MALDPGAELGPLVIESVSPEAMHVLAVLLDDPNQIHLDAEVVKALGMGDRVINQGPANFAYMLDMLRAAVPGAIIRDFRVRLLANVFGGDRVIAAGRVESVSGPEATCSVWLDIDGGARAVEGTATLTLTDQRT
jgi:3-hydroxybutyryl-CoA dehydratase